MSSSPAPGFLGNIPPKPSELYLAQVMSKKKASKKYALLARGGRGLPEHWVSTNYLKACRKAMVMAYQEGVRHGYIKKRPPNPRQLAAAVLDKLMTPHTAELAPGLTVTVPSRFMQAGRHTDYTHALQFYFFHLRPQVRLQRPMPGAPPKFPKT